MKLKHIMTCLFLAVLFLTGCEDAAKTGADAAIKAGQTAFDAVKDEAAKYVPTEAKGVADALASAKTAFEKQDYAGALTTAKDIAAKAGELGPAAMKAKEQLTSGWNDAAGSLPKMMTEVQTRATALSKAGKMPKEAADQLTAAKGAWEEASAAFKSGNLADAMAKANVAKNDLTEVAKALGVKVAAAAK